MNQDPVEQYPDYYAPSAYRSTRIPQMPAESEGEHSDGFRKYHLRYGRFPWSQGSDRVCPVGGVKDQFDDLRFENAQEGPDFWTHERIVVMTTNRLANIVGTIHFVSLMFQVGFFVSIGSMVISLFDGIDQIVGWLIFSLYFLVPYLILNKGVKFFVEKKSTCSQKKTAAFTAAPAWCGCG
jgi:uncharacterized membrane protein SirB2